MIDNDELLCAENRADGFAQYCNRMRLGDSLYFTTPSGLARNIEAMREALNVLEEHLDDLYGDGFVAGQAEYQRRISR